MTPGTLDQFLAGQPGIYYGIPEAVYRALDACCNSDLGVIDERCEAQLAWNREHPPESEEHFDVGTAVHALVLERKPLADMFAIGGPINPKTNKPYGSDTQAYKGWAAMQGKPCISQASADAAEACARRVLDHPLAGMVFAEGKGQPEVSILWKREEDDGLLCKARIDYLRADDGVVADLKTTKDASPKEFPKRVYKYGYNKQAWHYIDGLAHHEIVIDKWIIAAVERAAPHLVATCDLDWKAINRGGRQLKSLYRRYALSKAAGLWPNYGFNWKTKEYDFIKIGLPTWADRIIEVELES